MIVIHLLLWCLQGTDSKPCCRKSQVNKIIYMATYLRNAQQLLAFVDSEDIVSNDVLPGYIFGFLFNCVVNIPSMNIHISVHHCTISSLCQLLVFWRVQPHQTKLSESKIATVKFKVFLFSCCEPLCFFRHIDPLLHLHLEIITIYVSTSIFIYTCHMFLPSFQNQWPVSNYKCLYINLQSAYKRYHLSYFGSAFPNNHGPTNL